MKKYLLGLTSVVFALAFSAFTKPFTFQTFKLKTNPVAADIVKNPAQWTTAISGQYFGACSGPTQDLACKIQLDDSETLYFHTEGGEVILNTFAYADAQSTKQGYLVIGEATGLSLGGGVYDRIITSIAAYRWDPDANGQGHGAYIYASLGSNLSFTNAQEIDF
jgi:hypothetical protein